MAFAVATSMLGCGARTELGADDDDQGGGGGSGETSTTSGNTTTGGDSLCHPGDPAEKLATGYAWPYGLALTNDRVFFTDYDSGGALLSVPKAGGAVTTLAAFDYPDGLAIADGQAFVAVSGESRVVRIAVGGGIPTPLFASSGPTDLVVGDAGDLYVAEYLGNAVVRAEQSGGPKTTLASNEEAPFRIALTPTRVVFSTLSRMGTVPRQGGDVTHVDVSARAFATDGETIYASIDPNPAIVRIDLDGAVTTLWSLGADSGFIDGIALDGDRLFFTQLTQNVVSIESIRTDGTDLRTHVSEPSGPFPSRVVLDDSCLYATFGGDSVADGFVLRAPKN